MLKRFIFLLFLQTSISAIDNPHFYKSSQFFYKPRLEEDWLLSFEAFFGGGQSENSYNNYKENTCILNLYGPSNLHLAGKGVSEKILNCNPDGFLNNFWQDQVGPYFGKIIFDGHFKIAQIYFDYQKNLQGGFFYQINLPVRKMAINSITIKDLSQVKNKKEANWQDWKSFITNLRSNLKNYGICLSDEVEKTGVGDLAIMFGKTVNYENTTHIDFIDATIKFGILFPTGKENDPNILFDLPTGYDGYWGFPIFTSFGLGLFEWLTLGTYFNGYFFSHKNKEIRVQTAQDQSGFIKLEKIMARTKHGNIFTTGIYFEADHFMKGYSLLVSYQYNKQYQTKIQPINNTNLNQEFIDADPMFQGFSMNNVNIYFEWDFASIEHPNAPHIRVSLDIPFNGRNIFDTKIGAFTWGIDYGCKF